MLSFASVAMRSDKSIVAEFTANLLPLPGAKPHPRTMLWWENFPAALAMARENPEDPAEALPRYVKWLRKLPGRTVMLGQPAAFDFMWIYWYLQRFCDDSPFGHSALDIKTYAMAMLKKPYRDCVTSALPKASYSESVSAASGARKATRGTTPFMSAAAPSPHSRHSALPSLG